MHGELIKHSMREDGEDNIYDTAGMAICLGVVQNYTFEHASAKSPWKFMRKQQTDEEREDALYGSFAGANGDDSASIIEGLMLTKKACMDFAEELQLEISEVSPPSGFTHAHLMKSSSACVPMPHACRCRLALPPGAAGWDNTAILQQVMCAAAKAGKGKRIAHIKLLQVDKLEDDSISGFEKPRRCLADLFDIFPVAGKNNVGPFRIFLSEVHALCLRDQRDLL